VTSTTPNVPISLSVADGSGSTNPAKRGHLLASTGKPVPLPLEVNSSAGDLMSVDQPIAPVVATWPDVVSLSPVTFELSQEINGTSGLPAGPYGAEVLVTLTSDAP
jgi:hypothetical protein